MSRSAFLRAGGALAFSLAAGGASAAWAQAAGGPTLDYATYAGWIGPHEYSTFQRQSGIKIHEIDINVDDDRIAKLATDPTAFDFLLLTAAEVQRVVSLGIAARIDTAKVPNYRLVSRRFKVGPAAGSKPLCVVTDYGRTGFAYRKDIVKEKLTSWKDLWRVAPKYSGKITFLDFPAQVLPSVLIMLGYPASSTDPKQIEAAGQALIKIKPDIQAFVQSDLAKGLIDGSAAIAMDWDYDIFLAQQKNRNIVWVNPAEGAVAYQDVWVVNRHSKNVDAILKWFNFHYAPRNYAQFINAVGAAYCEPAASKYINHKIRTSEILHPSDKVLRTVQFGKAVGRAQVYYDRAWAQVKGA